ncbi:hypothetical protein BT63DRAFT_199495 [Microthyrium microscopicum]|uniref:Amine oxidase n=1 Tax=Microthyrium microscopicum TaxID=703497 RepID=A0A6A6UGB9_9PEZI|nr:hypothetical protein BT63DRAFT_199495 [Microthyrium microscopicum]
MFSTNVEQEHYIIPDIIRTRHPFASLSEDEIAQTASAIRSLWPKSVDLQFKALTLHEPPKAEVLVYLEAEHTGVILPQLHRKAFVNYYIRNTNRFHEAVVNISRHVVERNVRLGPNIHGPADGEEILAMERIALDDEGVQRQIQKLKLPAGTVVVIDPWIYGSDGVEDDDRMYQCFLYMRDPTNSEEADSNHYAFPLPISPVISTLNRKVIRIDMIPTGADSRVRDVQPYVPRLPNEYISEHQDLRTDLKPLHVVQPEGVSFQVMEQDGTNIVEWQKWRIRVGFNQREGVVLHDVRYDSRSLFYRVSLSDANIPYADPRAPLHRKSAFDLGDVGAGIMSNNLKLGCDCLGSIYYMSGLLADDKGQPMPMPNVICIHEQDGGIGWKHTNYRTGRASVVRSRELVIQSIITVANYEYILAFNFNQAAEMHYEVRATGILSTQPIDADVGVPYGTIIHPGVLAVHHQHIFSLRIDPHIDDSPNNRLVYTEAHPMSINEINPHGTGYTIQQTPINTSGGYDLDFQHSRVYAIQNTSSLNPINNLPVSYKISLPPVQPILANPSSLNAKRAEFADHAIYAVRYREDELYAGGRYTNQSRGGTGVSSWAARNDDILNQDLVLFVQFGLNDVPRCEDFPVMQCEKVVVGFKPVNFFGRNPAIDVPPSEQQVNKSVGLNQEAGKHMQGAAQLVIEDGGCCAGSKL